MQPAAASTTQATDIATRIAYTMRQMGVVGLPRNYEIFYDICTGSNEELCDELRELGNRPTQAQLDVLSRKYFAQRDGARAIEDARDQVATKIEEVMSLLRRERSSLEKYGVILDKTSDGLNSRQAMTKDILVKIVGIMSAATDSTIEQGKQIASSMMDKSAELEKVKTTLEEYKRLADTDPLTQIWNRRAFDRALANIYDNAKGKMFNALMLADIDRFKDVNDRFGHPVGDDLDDAVAEAVRTAVETTSFVNSETQVNYGPITVSMGICMASEANSPDDLYSKADRALYASKVSGRNQVTRHSALADVKARKNWFIYKTS